MTETLAPSKKRKPWILPVAIAVPVVVIAAVAYLFWPRDLTVTGELVLTDKTFGTLHSDCKGEGGYSDLVGGAEVTVTDPSGTVVGLGHLGDGSEVHVGECHFAFSLSVPAGKGIYGVTVAHRDGVKFSEADLSKPLVLSVGG